MKAVIIGNGMVGQELAKTFLENGYEVSIIDKDKEIIQEITNKYDISGVVGDGISKTIQIKAGIDYCDVAVILTSDNATNILAGIEAKKNGAKYVIVRVKNFSEKKDLEDLRKTYGIDLILDSIDYGAEYISQMIRIPSIIKQVFFASKNQVMLEMKVSEKSKISGLKLSEISQKTNLRFLICAIRRNEEIIIPNGNSILQPGDHIFANVSIEKNFDEMLKYFDLLSHKINSTIIFGGNNLGKRIIENLLKNNIQIIVVEEDLNLCQELSKEFPNIKVIYGNFGDNTFLKSLKIKQYDSVICATMQDQMNLIISLYAKNEGVKKVIARIDNIIYSNLLTQSKIDTQVSIDYLVFDEIFRNLKNIQTQNEIISKYELSKDIYAYEFNVDKNFPYLNVKIKDSKFKIKENILFGMIARNNQNIVVNGDTYLTEGDRVIVITTNEKLKQLKDILQ